MKDLLIGTVAVVAFLGMLFLLVTKTPVPAAVTNTFGNSGTEHYELEQFNHGFQTNDSYATTTPASATLSALETAGFSTVSFYPSVGAITLTLPASTTLGAFLGPTPGAMKRVCYYNATTTSGITITLAAGTGIDLEIASTTVTGSGPSLTLLADNTACIEYQKKSSASTTAANRFDIVARLVRFVDGD